MKYFILSIFGLAAFTIIALLFSSFETIQAGERGLVLRFGEVTEVLEEGFHVVNPLTSDIKVMNIQTQKYEVQAPAASRDLQTVTSAIAVNFRLDGEQIDQLYITIGTGYLERVVQPAVQESVKAATAKFNAEELISKRAEVKEVIKSELTVRLSKSFMIVEDVSITNFDFSPEFNAAVEAKVTAEQSAFKAENDLKRIEFEAQQQIESAKAEAESTRLQVEALKNGSQIVELRQTEALLEFAKKWNGSLPATMIVGGNGALPLLDLTNKQ